jgi:hypothetical protein
MTTDLGSASSVLRIINKTTSDIDTTTVESYISEIIRFLKAKYYGNYMLDKYFITMIPATETANMSYNTYFPMKNDATKVKVYLQGVLLTKDVDYTLDLTNSVVTLLNTQSVGDGQVIAIFYCPEFFDDYVNYMAAKRLIDRSMIDLSNASNGQAIYNNIRFQTKEYEDLISQKPYVAAYTDHFEDNGIF